MRFIVIFFLLSTVRGAINPAGLFLDVRQEQMQQQQLHSRTSDGRRDRSIKQVRVLNLSCRYLGDGADEPAILRWFFIGKSPVDGKFDYYSIGSHEVVIPRRKPLQFRIVSEPLNQDRYVEKEFLTSIHVTAGSIPQGWVLMISQAGLIVKQTASTPGLIEWMQRNPPPAESKRRK
jgi:hypothetical protein